MYMYHLILLHVHIYYLILVHVHVPLDITTCTYISLEISTCTYIYPLDISTCTRTGKKVRIFESLNLRSFAMHSKLNFSLRSFAAMPNLMFAHAWLIMWAFSIKVDAVLLAASVSFLCPAMLNPSRNSDRNQTSTRYKAIIQF